MSSALVVTGGTAKDQQDPQSDLPPLDDVAARSWLAVQPEFLPELRLWVMPGLTAEVYPEHEGGALRMITFSVSVTDPDRHDADYASLKARLLELAARLGVAVWDDDEEDFLQPSESRTG